MAIPLDLYSAEFHRFSNRWTRYVSLYTGLYHNPSSLLLYDPFALPLSILNMRPFRCGNRPETKHLPRFVSFISEVPISQVTSTVYRQQSSRFRMMMLPWLHGEKIMGATAILHGENFMAIFTTLSVVISFSTGTLGIFVTLVYDFTMRVIIYDILSMPIIPTLSTSIIFCNLCYILL